MDKNGVHDVDHENKVIKTITNARVDTEIFPLITNYDPRRAYTCLTSATFSPTPIPRQLHPSDRKFLAANPKYHGISLGFQEIPSEAQPGYRALSSRSMLIFSRAT